MAIGLTGGTGQGARSQGGALVGVLPRRANSSQNEAVRAQGRWSPWTPGAATVSSSASVLCGPLSEGEPGLSCVSSL